MKANPYIPFREKDQVNRDGNKTMKRINAGTRDKAMNNTKPLKIYSMWLKTVQKKIHGVMHGSKFCDKKQQGCEGQQHG